MRPKRGQMPEPPPAPEPRPITPEEQTILAAAERIVDAEISRDKAFAAREHRKQNEANTALMAAQADLRAGVSAWRAVRTRGVVPPS